MVLYDLELSSDPEAGGTTSGAGSWAANTFVTITATPAEGYMFTGWSGDFEGASPEANVYMNGSKTIVANFALQTFTVTLLSNPDGAATFTGSGIYNYGETATITAIPSSNFSFISWSGGIDSVNNPEDVAVTSDLVITANLIRPEYSLSLIVSPPGTGVATGSGDYPGGQVVAIQAFPNDGQQFDSWSGDLVSALNPESVTMGSSKSITANFVPISFTLITTSSPSIGGTVSGAGDYNAGTTVGVIAIPASGYAFAGWTGDLSGTTNPATILMDSDKSITAIFVVATYHLTAESSDETKGAVTGTGDYAVNTNATIQAFAAPGYQFDTWLLDNTTEFSENPAVIFMDSDKHVVAYFMPA